MPEYPPRDRDPPPALQVDGVVCSRGDRPLFEPVSFTLTPGALVHIQGPNGRGKTTLMRAVAGLSWIAEGEIRWAGRRIGVLAEDYRREVVYVGHLNGIHGELTPIENLRFFGALEGLSRTDAEACAETALAKLRIAGRAELPAKYLSQGQRRRLALGRLLMTGRPLWLLDEPFAALDTRSVAELAGLIENHLRGGGLAALISHQDVPIAGMRQGLSLESVRRTA
ncbi:MAG: cytochrome c biogenesis heme-transporting ATPase CcmA [Acidiferrobacteraceae bacterium]